MKLHLPLGLRAALLSVLAALSFAHGNTFRMEGFTNKSTPANGETYWNWNTFWTDIHGANATSGTFESCVHFVVNSANWELNKSAIFAGGANISVSSGFTATITQGHIGRNSDSVITLDNGRLTMNAASETSSWGNAGIGYGEGSMNTITLTNGSIFTLNGGYIARNKSHADITVNAGTTFNLQDGSIGTESGSSVDITVGGTFNMSGGRIGDSLSSTKGTAQVTVAQGGAFKMSGGRLGYSGSINLEVQSGGTMVISGGSFSLDDRGSLSFSGHGVGGEDYANGANSALCVTSKLEGYVKHNVTIDGATTFNIFNPGNEITFVGQFTFGGSTLTKVGQGSIIFTDTYNSLQMTSGYFSTAEGDSGVVNISRGMVKFDFSASDAFADFAFNLNYGANVTGTLFVAEGGSYVLRQLGGALNGEDNRGALTGGGTLIIDYSGDTPAVSAANVVADETEGAPSLTKRGSGEQQITGAVAAKDISVNEGTLTLGSAGHGVTAKSFSTATGTALKLGGDAVAEQLSATGGSIEASGSLEIGNVASGAQLTDLTMANGGTLAVGGGTLGSESVTFSGDGTLTVNLTNETHLDFGAFVHGNITLTLSDTFLLFDNDFSYRLFTGDSYTSDWGENITLESTTIGRKSVEFDAANGSLTITGSAVDLTWAGGNLTWLDAAEATNEWQTGGGTDRFYTGDRVTFDNETGGTVTLSGAIIAEQMSVARGTWNFTGETGLEVVKNLAVAEGASATITAPTTVGGNVENEGTLALNGDTAIKGSLLSDGTLTATGNVHVTGAIGLQGGTAQFGGSVTGTEITIANTENATFNGDFSVYTGNFTTVRNSTVVFNGSDIQISALNITGGSHVTFSGTGLTLGNFYQEISGGSEVHLALDLSSRENTTSSSSGYVISKYIRMNDADSRFVVHGYVNGQNMTYKYRQNYNLVYGEGTLVMLDTGYQVHNGDTPTEYWDGSVLYGDGILSRFLSKASSAAATNTIRVLELTSSENSAHPTVIVFNKYNSYAGYLLKHTKELHVKDGAALGFAYKYDSEYNSIAGPRNMWTSYAPSLVLHLAGTGAVSGTERTGKGAALFLTDSDGSDTTEHTVTVPWKIILDDATTINTVTAGAELLLTNELTNAGGYTLTKSGKGKLTLGSGFRTADGSTGRIDVAAGTLALGYSEENALKDFSLMVTPGSGSISLQGGRYAVKFLGNIAWTDNTTTNSMVSGSGTLIIDMPSDNATANIGFAATSTGEKVSLVKRGGGNQILRGAATLDGLTLEEGTLTLNGVSTAATLTGEGGSLTVSNLSVEQATGELGTLNVAAGGTLKIGSGLLSGESLVTAGAATLNVSLAGNTHLNFADVSLGGRLTLELSDLFAPDGLDTGSPYQLFDADAWDSDWDANVSLATTQLGRLTVGFENGAIVVTGGERGDLTWASESATVWQAAASDNLFWTNAAGEQDFFYNGDNVTFATAGEHSISVVGTVSAGTMSVSAGTWNFAVGSSLAVAGKLTLAAGTSVTFSGASAALQGGAEVGSGATLAFTGTNAELGGAVEVQGGTLSLSAAATTIGGSIVATSGSVSVTNGSVSSTGSITLGSEDSAATMTVSSTGTKSLGDVTVNAGSVFTATTATGWQAGGTRVSGAGTLALSGMGYNAVGADAGLLGSFISTAAVGVETAKLGVLSLSANSALGFSGSGEALTNALSRIEEIHVGSRGSLGFVTGGGRAFEGTTGVLHLSGSGTGAGGEKYEEGINAALYVGNGVTATMPWDVALDADTVLNPINQSSILYFTGALTSAGRTITKNGQGSIILSNTFTTKPVDGSAQDSGTIAVYRGTLTLAYTDEDALSGYTISLARSNTPYGKLSAEAGGRYVIKGITNAGANEGGYITGEGTLAINTAGESYTTSAEVTAGEDAALTLEKLGKGTQSISGDVELAALKVTEGTLALGGVDKTVTVKGEAVVAGTLSMGTSLTLGTLSGAGTVTGSGTLSGDISAFTGSIETDGTWQLTSAQSGNVELKANFAGSGSIALGYADAASITLSGVASESISIDHSGEAVLTLTGENTSTGTLTLHDNAAELGTEAAAAAWMGTVEGSGELKLVHGTLGQAVTNGSISLHVDAHGVVNAGETAGAALKSVAINEGGRLTGVSGEIAVSAAATQSMQLTFGTGNIGEDGQSLIEAGGVRVAEGGSFAIDFTNDALVEILKLEGAEVQLQVVSGGALDLGSIESLSDIASGYAELLLAYSKVQAEDGALVLLGEEEEPPVVDPDEPVDPNPPVVDPDDPVDPNPPVVDPDDPVDPNPPVVDPDEPVDPNPPVVDPDEPVDPNPPVIDPDEPVDPNPPVVDPQPPAKRVYLVLADGSADAATIRDYSALDNRIATVLDADTQLTLELADDAERGNSICVSNLVGLSGSALIVRSTGSEPVTIELHNSLQEVRDDATLPGGMSPESARGFDTEFEGLIVGEAGVNFVKSGAGTLTVGSKALARSVERGGVQIEDDLEIQQGAIVIRGGGESSVGSLSFNYNEEPTQADEQRGLTVTDGSSLTAGGIREHGDLGEDNAISLQQNGELILTGHDSLESTRISGSEGGTLTLTDSAELELVEAASLSGVEVQVEGGSLSLDEGADMNGGSLSIYSGGNVALGSGSGIREAEGVDIAEGGELAISAGSEGVHSVGVISLADGASLSLAEGTASSAAGLTGSGAVLGKGDASLAITGQGSVFSGELVGTGTLQVDENADFTLSGITTAEDSQWNAQVFKSGTLTVDMTGSELDATLGDITLGNNSKLIYKYDNETSPHLNAHIVVAPGDKAELVISSYGRTVESGDEINFGSLSYDGWAENLVVRLRGTTFAYFDGELYWDATDGGQLKIGLAESNEVRNKFLTGDMQANARAGAEIFWDALNPRGRAWAHIVDKPEGDLAQFVNTLYDRMEDNLDVSRELAAGAGSAIATLGAAAAEDMRRQLGNLRNRATIGDFGRGAWLSAESSYRKQGADGLAPGFTLNGWGGSVGYDDVLSRRAGVGVSLTAMYNDLKTSAADSASGDVETTYVSAWSRVMSGAWMHTFIASAGLVDASLNRTVSYGEGQSYSTKGSTDGYSLGAMYELGYTHLLNEQGTVALQPVANIQLRHTALGGYSESGSDAGLRVDDITQTTITLGFGLRLQGVLSPHALGRSAWFEARVLAKADVGDRCGEAHTGLIYGDRSAAVKSAALGATGVELGAGVSLPVGQGGSIFADASAELRSGYTGYGAAVGYKLNF